MAELTRVGKSLIEPTHRLIFATFRIGYPFNLVSLILLICIDLSSPTFLHNLGAK